MDRKAGTASDLARLYDAAKAGQRNEWGITFGMLKYVDLISDLQAEGPGGEWVQVSQADIARKLGLASNSVNPPLCRLIEVGLLDHHRGSHGMGIPDSYRAGWMHELISVAKRGKDPAIETKPVPLSDDDMKRLPAAVALMQRFIDSVVSSAG